MHDSVSLTVQFRLSNTEVKSQLGATGAKFREALLRLDDRADGSLLSN